MLAERMRWLRRGAPAAGSFCLYWMQTCIRAHHNPALLTAALLSKQLSAPLLVVMSLPSSAAPSCWSTARRMAFAIESAIDARAEVQRLGGELVLFLEQGMSLRGVQV